MLRRGRAMLAVEIVLDVALHAGRTGTVSAAAIAERTGQARRGIEPLMQALSRAGLLDSVRGPRGGYRLGRAPRDLPLSAITAVATEQDEPITESRLRQAAIAPVWADLETVLTDHLARVTVADLLKRAEAAGLRRTPAEPLNFAI